VTTNSAEYQRDWKKAHPEKVQEYRRAWNEAHPGKQQEYIQQWRETHPGKVREYNASGGGAPGEEGRVQRQVAETHKDEQRAYRRAYRKRIR